MFRTYRERRRLVKVSCVLLIDGAVAYHVEGGKPICEGRLRDLGDTDGLG
jgi:hypothetical protein